MHCPWNLHLPLIVDKQMVFFHKTLWTTKLWYAPYHGILRRYFSLEIIVSHGGTIQQHTECLCVLPYTTCAYLEFFVFALFYYRIVFSFQVENNKEKDTNMHSEGSLSAREKVGVQDFVLLDSHTSETAFLDNLRKRFQENLIYVMFFIPWWWY